MDKIRKQLDDVMDAINRFEKCQASMVNRLNEHIEEETTDLRTVTDWIRAGQLSIKVMAWCVAVIAGIAAAWGWIHSHFSVSTK